jgi:hypothetical protein
MENIAIFCADVGSIKAKKFGWAADTPDQNDILMGTDIEAFANLISSSISNGSKVAIGFECPLFVPMRSDPLLVNSARNGEGNRSWSAGAGTGALATGLVEVLWVLKRVAALQGQPPKAELSWPTFINSHSVFLWEAFVTSGAKGSGHAEDAAIAIECFKAALPNLGDANAIEESSVLSLVGAAALRAGWADDINMLSAPCLVIKA